jgi:hypothetical protein
MNTDSNSWTALREQWTVWVYRVSAYVVLNLVDDVPMLALAFCW